MLEFNFWMRVAGTTTFQTLPADSDGNNDLIDEIQQDFNSRFKKYKTETIALLKQKLVSHKRKTLETSSDCDDDDKKPKKKQKLSSLFTSLNKNATFKVSSTKTIKKQSTLDSLFKSKTKQVVKDTDKNTVKNISITTKVAGSPVDFSIQKTVEHFKLFPYCEAHVRQPRLCILNGPYGCGKTFAVEHKAREFDLDVLSLNLDDFLEMGSNGSSGCNESIESNNSDAKVNGKKLFDVLLQSSSQRVGRTEADRKIAEERQKHNIVDSRAKFNQFIMGNKSTDYTLDLNRPTESFRKKIIVLDSISSTDIKQTEPKHLRGLVDYLQAEFKHQSSTKPRIGQTIVIEHHKSIDLDLLNSTSSANTKGCKLTDAGISKIAKFSVRYNLNYYGCNNCPYCRVGIVLVTNGMAHPIFKSLKSVGPVGPVGSVSIGTSTKLATNSKSSLPSTKTTLILNFKNLSPHETMDALHLYFKQFCNMNDYNHQLDAFLKKNPRYYNRNLLCIQTLGHQCGGNLSRAQSEYLMTLLDLLILLDDNQSATTKSAKSIVEPTMSTFSEVGMATNIFQVVKNLWLVLANPGRSTDEQFDNVLNEIFKLEHSTLVTVLYNNVGPFLELLLSEIAPTDKDIDHLFLKAWRHWCNFDDQASHKAREYREDRPARNDQKNNCKMIHEIVKTIVSNMNSDLDTFHSLQNQDYENWDDSKLWMFPIFLFLRKFTRSIYVPACQKKWESLQRKITSSNDVTNTANKYLRFKANDFSASTRSCGTIHFDLESKIQDNESKLKLVSSSKTRKDLKDRKDHKDDKTILLQEKNDLEDLQDYYKNTKSYKDRPNGYTCIDALNDSKFRFQPIIDDSDDTDSDYKFGKFSESNKSNKPNEVHKSVKSNEIHKSKFDSKTAQLNAKLAALKIPFFIKNTKI